MEALTDKLVVSAGAVILWLLLKEEFRSLLDEATILSISNDYDLTKSSELDAARDILRSISEHVEAEEATGFNASGFGVNDVVEIPSGSNAAEHDLKSNDGLTSTTESSVPQSRVSGVSSKTSTGDAADPFRVSAFDGLSDEDKEVQLAEMFTSLKPIDVKLALKKHKGNASLALDDLLNVQMLEQSGQRLKGVDGFYVSDDDSAARKKKKGKKKKPQLQKSPSSGTSTPGTSEDTPDVDEDGDLAFISERLDISASDAAEIYRNNHRSVGATIVKILENYIALGLSLSIPRLNVSAQEQSTKYSWVPPKYVLPAFELTNPNSQHALDIIEALAGYFAKPAHLKYDVPYNIAVTTDHHDIELAEEIRSPRHGKALSPTSPRHAAWSESGGLQSATALKASLAASREQSMATASAAFRKGRSSPYFRQVGGFYAERAREETRELNQARSVEAEYLVNQNSTRTAIDLHGVTVQDGVDIALQRAWRWWDGLGEERTRKAKEGFTVITGVGRHSAEGKSVLRIRVGKALVEDGWKVEVQTGKFLVTGRRR